MEIPERIKTLYDDEPSPYFYDLDFSPTMIPIAFRENFVYNEDKKWWEGDVYVFQLEKNDYNMEHIKELVELNYNEWLAEAKYESEAERIRSIRNSFLSQSDQRMMLDRLNLTGLSAEEAISKILDATSGAWAQYRQQLRDITTQAGFPFNVSWPAEPDQ